jgi:hypothetical protein
VNQNHVPSSSHESSPPALDDWAPLGPAEAALLFADYEGAWRIAGGWAIDLFAGEPYRSHADIDIEIDRNDLGLLHDALPGWMLYAANRIVTLWSAGEPFPDDTTDIWCRRPGRPWEMQLMTAYTTTDEWVYKRDARIRGLLADRTLHLDGLPIAAPEIQLLYKSKGPARPKDEQDFRTVLAHLSQSQRSWLDSALAIVDPENPWREALDTAIKVTG